MSKPIRVARRNLRLLMAFAIANGWNVTRTHGGHIKFTKQGLTPIFTSSTASDHRSENNARAQLRRADRLQSQPSQEAR